MPRALGQKCYAIVLVAQPRAPLKTRDQIQTRPRERRPRLRRSFVGFAALPRGAEPMFGASARAQLRAAANIAPIVQTARPPPTIFSWHDRLGRPDRTTTSSHAVPSTHLSLSRVGVTNVEKVIRIRLNEIEQLFYAQLECFVDLGPHQKGAHMSRFEEVVNEAIDEVILGEAFKAETLAQHIAERVRDRQEGLRAEVTIAARYPERKLAPASGLGHPGDLHAVRLGRGLGTRHPAHRRRGGPGNDRLPVRPGDGELPLARAPGGGRLQRGGDRADLPQRAGGDPQPARDRPPARGMPGGLHRTTSRRRRCWASWNAR